MREDVWQGGSRMSRYGLACAVPLPVTETSTIVTDYMVQEFRLF
jgi:hypothetical protein